MTHDKHCPRPMHRDIRPEDCHYCESITAAVDEAVAKEQEVHLKYLLVAYDAFKRTGWETGLSDREAMDKVFDHLCNCDCDPNLSPKAAAIRGAP